MTGESRSPSPRPAGALTAEDLISSRRGRSLVFAYVQNAAEVSLLAADYEVTEKFGDVPLPEPTWRHLRFAMGCVVGGAMYWQPPHAEDQLCEDPAMKRALMPVAELLIDSGELSSWADSIALANQWDVQWFDTAGQRQRESADDQGGTTSAERLAEWRAEVIASEARYRLDALKHPGQEVSGEWWSTPPPQLWSTTQTWPDGTPIGLWLVEDDFGQEEARARGLSVRSDVRILEIDSPEDWAELCRRHSIDVTYQRHCVWREATGREGHWVIPDWSAVAQDFDGVRVSLAGYLRTAGTIIDIDRESASLLAGWNPGQTFWLNDVVTGVDEVVDWSLDDDTDEWRRVHEA